jgi:hypothetical protein
MKIEAKFGKFGRATMTDDIEAQLEQIGSYQTQLDLEAVAKDPISKWIYELIARAKRNLESQQPNPIVNSELLKSIRPTAFEITDADISIEVQGNGYWKFVDKGVQGAKENSRAPGSPYKYRDKKPPQKALQSWIASKKIPVIPRYDKKLGRERTILEQSYVDARGIAKLIWRRGLRATNFMTDALEESFIKQLTEQIAEEIGRKISFTGPPEK